MTCVIGSGHTTRSSYTRSCATSASQTTTPSSPIRRSDHQRSSLLQGPAGPCFFYQSTFRRRHIPPPTNDTNHVRIYTAVNNVFTRRIIGFDIEREYMNG